MFFLEYDGKKTNTHAYNKPVDQVTAMHVKQALDKFSKKNRLICARYDVLQDGGYRAYLVQKSWLRGQKELIYYIENRRT